MDFIFLAGGFAVFFVFPALVVYRLHSHGRIWTLLHIINWFAITIFIEEAILMALGLAATALVGDSSIVWVLAYGSMLSLIFPFVALVLINVFGCIILILRSVFDARVKADIFGMMFGFGLKPEEQTKE